MSTQPLILDPASGSRMCYFDKDDARVLFGDVRSEEHILCDGRVLNINPSVQMDFTNLPFQSGLFKFVVFDPPHLIRAGKKSWLAKKYGVLSQEWRADLRAGFAECFRVLQRDGVLVFKWNETQVPVSEILKLTDAKPLIGHLSGKRSNTHWIMFIKEDLR